jgi:hypothetical protein
VKAFISYSTRDKKHGAVVRRALESLGIQSFLAHETLKVSDDWKKTILKELGACKIFVPILSAAFKKSQWCGQETGIVSQRRGVLIYPLSIDRTVPYGFISHIQGKSLRGGALERSTLVDVVAARWPGFAIDVLLNDTEKVYTFRQAESVVAPLVPYFGRMSMEQAQRFAKTAVENGQIWDSHLCRDEYLPRFLAEQRANIANATYRALKYQIKNQRTYEAR